MKEWTGAGLALLAYQGTLLWMLRRPAWLHRCDVPISTLALGWFVVALGFFLWRDRNKRLRL